RRAHPDRPTGGGMALIQRLQDGVRWCLGLCLLLPFAAMAEPLRLDAETFRQGHVLFEGHLEAYFDASGTLAIEQLIADEADLDFEPLARNFNGGFSRHGAW